MTGLIIRLGAQDVLAADSREQVASHAHVAPDSVIEIADLAKQAFEKDARAVTDALARDTDIVIGCSRPRAVQSLLDYAAVDTAASRITWLQLPFDRAALQRGYGVPWFPVIDRTRCTGCGTCADYCLFSVYATEPSATVRVAMPQYCKIGCPACARLCPTGALIFPFCAEPELNGEIADPPTRNKENALEALGDDPMRVLTERRNKRRLTDPAKFDQAEKDRITFSGIL